MLRTRFLPVAAAALLVVTGACGDDDDALATADFIGQADEICEAAEEKSDALPDPEDLESLADLIPQQQEIFEELRDDLRALGTPEDPEVRDDLLTRLDVVLGDLEDLAAATEDSEARVLEVAGDAEENSDETEEILSGHGFTECGIDDDDDGDGDGDGDIGDGDVPSDFDIDDYPVQHEPSDDDVAALAEILAPEFGGMLTDEEVSCVARFILERATLLELDDTAAEGLGEAAALDCLSLDRLLEIGQEVG